MFSGCRRRIRRSARQSDRSLVQIRGDAQEEEAVPAIVIAGASPSLNREDFGASGFVLAMEDVTFDDQLRAVSQGSVMDFLLPGTLAVGLSLAAWLVLPSFLRRCHEFVESGAKGHLLGGEYADSVPFEQSVFGALEDPARLFAGALTFSYLGWLVAPKSLGSLYLSEIRSGLMVLSVMWFLYLYKRNLFARVVARKALSQDDKERYLTMDRLSSIGLLVLGTMALAESCGVAVQSVMTVGGIGGVATAFAARDILGNLLSGLGIQFSRPFSVGDYITAGDLTGQVVDIGLHSTEMLNRDKFPTVVPNSFFSSQVIVNRSRVRQRGLDLDLPVKLTSLEKLPTITSEVRSMLHSHPKVFLEDGKPHCHVSQVGATSFNLAISCNLKPMSWDDFLVAQEEILLEASRIVVRNDPEPDSEKSFSDGAEMVEKPVVHSSPESDDLPPAQADQKPRNPLGVSIDTNSPAAEPPVQRQEAWVASEYPGNSLAHRPSSLSRVGEKSGGPESPWNRQPEPSPRGRYGSNSQPDSPRKGGSSSILGVGSKLLSRIKNSKR